MKQHRVRIHQTGAPAVMQYETMGVDISLPGSGQVRLVQQAIGLNFVDTLFRSGVFSVSLPFDMGVEAAGTVDAIGAGVTGLKVGDRAAYFFTPGAYTDVRLIDASALVKLPDDVGPDVAATVLTKGLTAWMLVKRVHPVRAGETVLVHGAAGGVGSMVAAWAKALGATVIATVGTPEKADSVRALGIKHVLHTGDPEFNASVRSVTNGLGVDVVYEFVGKATFGLSVSALREGGTLAHVGNASGSPAAADKAALPARGVRYVQPSTGQYVGDRNSLELASADVFDAWRAGIFGATQATRYPLSEVVRAHEDLAARRITGAAILVP